MMLRETRDGKVKSLFHGTQRHLNVDGHHIFSKVLDKLVNNIQPGTVVFDGAFSFSTCCGKFCVNVGNDHLDVRDTLIPHALLLPTSKLAKGSVGECTCRVHDRARLPAFVLGSSFVRHCLFQFPLIMEPEMSRRMGCLILAGNKVVA